MYFPFLYGRRSELLAIRNVSEKYLATGLVTPIIEPTILKSADLVRCIEVLGERQQPAVVIVNPSQGELKGGASAEWTSQLDAALAENPTIIPGIVCHASVAYSTLLGFLGKYHDRQVAVLYADCAFSDAVFGSLMLRPNVLYHIILQGKVSASQQSLLPLSKAVYVFDHFIKKPRNADYVGREHFTNRHRLYGSSGAGFGDYTITGAELKLGGGPPGAVALHLTYKSLADGDLWIEHFVSDDVEIGQGTTEEKFLQAVAKFAAAYPTRGVEFGFNSAINDYFENHLASHCPGLGKNKERQIQHHIARVHDYLLTGQ